MSKLPFTTNHTFHCPKPENCRFDNINSVTVVSCLRLQCIIERASSVKVNPDPTYDIRFTYAFVESSLAIVAASAPAMRSLLGLWFSGLFSNKLTLTNSGAEVRPSQRGCGSNSSAFRGHRGIALHDIYTSNNHSTGIRSSTPTALEEEIMTCSGTKRTSEVDMTYDKDDRVDGREQLH